MSSAPQQPDLADLLPKDGVQSATRLGLCLSPNLGAEVWSRLVAGVAQAAGRSSSSRGTLTVWLGDLLAYGEGRYKGQIKEYARAAGLEPGTLRMAKLVCSRIPVFSRLNTVSWAHHCEIGTAFRDPVDIKLWLERAAKEGYSKTELRKRIREHIAANILAEVDGAATSFFGLMREHAGAC
jgi:TPR repeat protein